jgi:uncharacterized protein (TIGR02145 family)
MNIPKFTTFKTILIALVLTINANQLFSQTTNGIFFQAVARDNFSNPAKDRKIYVQSSIIQTTPTGIKVLTEEHQANTDATGVFSISLGNGVRVGGTATSLATIDWSKGPFYLNLKVAITPIGGNSNWNYSKEWVDMGTTSFGAVPFALYSASSAKVDDKLNVSDTTTMLKVYAKAMSVKTLETSLATKLTAADTLTMLAPYAKAAYTIDSSFFKSQLATKLSIADSAKYVTATQLASYNFSSGGTSSNTTTTTSVTMDSTSLSNRINLKANLTDLTALNTNIATNTASITTNTTAINLKAPIASPLFTGTVAIGTTNPSSAAALDITSTSQGLLLPRLSYVQKTAITSPVAGLVLWCSDCGTSGEMQVYNGTSFVNIVGGAAQFALPVISSTTGAYSITTSAAMSGGVITSDGGASITARGIVWGISAGSSTYSVTSGTGLGTFTSAITGLTSGVTYYVRAYATNSIGTRYGSEITLNTAQAVATLAVTTTVSSIGSTTATSGGNITYNGGATVTVSGVVWSTTSTPTISDSKTTDGLANGTYTSTITGLTPGTLYYVRSYATNSVGTNYGAQISFTTLNTATISATASATSITSSTATSGGTITTDGGAAVTSRGIVYGTTTESSTFSVNSGTGTGTYTSSLTGLSPATTYYVRSFATNSVGTVYGTEINFTTIAIEPTVSSTSAVTSITGSSATSGGTITSDGGASVTSRGLVWGTTTGSSTFSATTGTGTGTYTSSLTGLAPATLYYVRAFATNSIGTTYGAEISFTSLAITPTVTGTASATSVTSTTATSGGTITSDGGASVTARGIVYGTTTESSTFSATTGTGTGTYTISLTGLTPATTYYLRSFATNSVGTVYGTETNFTTIAIAPTLTTTAVSSITKYAASAGGTITSNGGTVITASGICWSTTATPTTSNFKTTDGTTSGTFTSSLTGLTAGTTYYVRAYATNAIGTSYGANESFTTLSTPVAQTSVLIGTQRWTDKNLNVANYRNGEAITYAANATEWAAANAAGEGAYTYLRFASGDGGATYGKLYNWYAVNNVRGLAPTGYHIPTKAEWATLRSIDPTGFTFRSNTTDWGASFTNSNDNLIVSNRISTPVGDNSTGFNALPGGSEYPYGNQGWYGSAIFWTATIDDVNSAKANWIFFYSTFFLENAYGTYELGNGMSVRLMKDNNTIETSPTTPLLASTTSATSITANSAILGGNISDEGATQVSVRGLVYGTSTGASTYSVTTGSGAGVFTSTLTGLSQGTKYFVRSFATNVQGTGYGAEESFTTQTTATVSVTATPTSLTTISAVGGGTISSTGGATITTSGLVWGASVNPEITLSTKTTDGISSGTFTSLITGLTQGTTYHVRAYATNYLGTSYGPGITFTTLTTPTVSATATVTSITGTTATSGGTISSDGGATVTTRGLVWGTSTGASTYSVTSGTGSGTYTSSLTGLSIATTYFVRAFATNSVGTVYGSEVTFATPNLPTLTASVLTIGNNSNGTSAVLSSELTDDGGASTTRGFVYGIGSYTYTSTAINTGVGTYFTTITSLTAGTTYQVNTYATNSAGTIYGSSSTSFTTTNYATLAATYSATTITGTTAESGGNITADGGSSVTTRGLIWGTTSPASTYSITIGTGTGTYTGTLTGLSGGTLYYVRAFATNNVGTTYGTEKSFNTADPVVTSPYTGRIWMDRNLGASRAATAANDTASYGDMYQWGRKTDGHEKFRNYNGGIPFSTTSTQLSSTQTVSSKFIVTPSSPYHWTSNWDVQEPWATDATYIGGINNPCPTGYRVPTATELQAELTGITNDGLATPAGAFSSFLKIPGAGYYNNGRGPQHQTVNGESWIWSSTRANNSVKLLRFYYSIGGWVATDSISNGGSVRCIKD